MWTSEPLAAESCSGSLHAYIALVRVSCACSCGGSHVERDWAQTVRVRVQLESLSFAFVLWMGRAGGN